MMGLFENKFYSLSCAAVSNSLQFDLSKCNANVKEDLVCK